jgi:hypothetical protein
VEELALSLMKEETLQAHPLGKEENSVAPIGSSG